MAPGRPKKRDSDQSSSAKHRENVSTPTHQRSPIKQRKMGISLHQKQALIDNLQLESTRIFLLDITLANHCSHRAREKVTGSVSSPGPGITLTNRNPNQSDTHVYAKDEDGGLVADDCREGTESGHLVTATASPGKGCSLPKSAKDCACSRANFQARSWAKAYQVSRKIH